MATIQEILAAPNMMGAIQGVVSGVPNPFDPAFLTTTRPTNADYGTYTKIDGTRKTARQVAYGAPSVKRTLIGLTQVPVKLIHSFEHIDHEPVVLQNLMMYESPTVQALGVQEIGRQTGEFKTLYSNLRISAVASALALGHIYFDGDGNLLPTSAGNTVDVDFQIPAGNQDQLDWDGNGDIIDASWAVAGTDIVSHISNLKTAAVRLTGYPLTTAYYGANTLGRLTSNTSILAFASRNASINAAMMQNIIPDGFLGLNWRPAQDHVFEDQDGDLQTIWDADRVTFIPAVNRSWYEMIEGTFPVPTNLGTVSADGLAAASAVSIERGMFNYAHLESADPVGIRHYAGDTMLPVIKVPKAVFLADTVF